MWWTCFYMMDSFTRLTAIKAWLEIEKLWLCFTTKYLSNASTIEYDITTEYRFISLFNPMSNCCFLSIAIYGILYTEDMTIMSATISTTDHTCMSSTRNTIPSVKLNWVSNILWNINYDPFFEYSSDNLSGSLRFELWSFDL